MNPAARAHALAVLATLPNPTAPGGGKFAAKAAQAERVNELHAQGLGVRALYPMIFQLPDSKAFDL